MNKLKDESHISKREIIAQIEEKGSKKE